MRPTSWGAVPEQNPPLQAIPAAAGDAIVFSEALTHGSTLNVSGVPRRTLYYCYSTGWMPDWGGQSLHFTADLGNKLSSTQAEIIRLK